MRNKIIVVLFLFISTFIVGIIKRYNLFVDHNSHLLHPEIMVDESKYENVKSAFLNHPSLWSYNGISNEMIFRPQMLNCDISLYTMIMANKYGYYRLYPRLYEMMVIDNGIFKTDDITKGIVEDLIHME